MSYSSEEKIKILYEDSLADIRELTTRIEAIGEMIVGASRTAAEAQMVAFDRNEAQLQSYQATLAEQVNRLPEALTRVAAGFATELKGVANDQLEGMTKANQNAVSFLNRHAAQLRADAAGAIANDVLVKLAEDRSQLVALTTSFGPELARYTRQVGELSESLAGLAGGMEQKVKVGYAVAEKSLEAGIERTIKGVLWGFVVGAASVGALVGGAVVAVLK